MRSPRARPLLVVTLVAAVGVPLGASRVVAARTDELAAEVSKIAEVDVRIGTVDADLTGAIRLSQVSLGDILTAETIEAAVALESLLAGELRADEIRVVSPRVRVQADADGDTDLARLVRRFARHGEGHARGPRRLRRIVVSGGTLTAQIDGVGELSAEGVELIPDEGGVRLVTGRVELHGTQTPLGFHLAFVRGAADLALPEMRMTRMLAVGGAGEIAARDHTLAVTDLVAGRLSAAGPYEVRGTLDDGGIPRAIAVELARGELRAWGTHLPLRGLGLLAPRGIGLDDTRVTGELRIRRGAQVTEVDARGSVAGLVIDHPALTAHPFTLDAAIDASLAIGPDAIAVSRLAIDRGALRSQMSGWLRRGAPIAAQVDVVVTPARCGDLLDAIPAEVRGPLDGMVLDGQLGGRGRLAVDLSAPPGEGVRLSAAFEGGCSALIEPPLADVTTLGSDPSITEWVPFKRLPARIRGAFVVAEDAQFFEHPGFDLVQIARSLEIDLRERRLVRGGSTISQQLVKNAFLTRRRTLDRKLQEAILTWRLEARVAKQAILEHYLNIIELGPRVHGIAAAGRYWFGASPRRLSVRQAAFLAALTSEPTSMSRRVRRHGGLDPASAERVATILRAMRRGGVISDEEHELARFAPMGFASAAVRADR